MPKWKTFALASLLTISGGSAVADTMTHTYADPTSTDFVWAGWTNATYKTVDSVGTPNITQMQVTETDGAITNLRFEVVGSLLNGQILPGDVFIDLDDNGSWDAYIKLLPNDESRGPVGGYSAFTSGNYVVYFDAGGLDREYVDGKPESGYLISDRSQWSADIRQNHAIGINDAYAGGLSTVGAAGVTVTDAIGNLVGWTNSPNTRYLNIDLTGFSLANVPGLSTSTNYHIAWQVNCANDLIYGDFTRETTPPVETPEPAELLLWLGAVGMLFVGRKRLFV